MRRMPQSKSCNHFTNTNIMLKHTFLCLLALTLCLLCEAQSEAPLILVASSGKVSYQSAQAKGKQKIKEAKDKLEKDKKSKKMKPEDIKKREAAIQQAEEQVGKLEASVKKGKVVTGTSEKQ